MCSKKQRLFSEVKSEGNVFKVGKKNKGAEGFVIECGAEFEPCGTATLFGHTISEVQKSLSTKCLLHKKYLQGIFAESILHACPTFSAHALAVERKKKELQIFPYFQSGSLVL
jgi:hypothetical protein